MFVFAVVVAVVVESDVVVGVNVDVNDDEAAIKDDEAACFSIGVAEVVVDATELSPDSSSSSSSAAGRDNGGGSFEPPLMS